MARLEGVKIIDVIGGEVTKIAYEGAEYSVVEYPEAGDIGMFITGADHDGEFTDIISVDGCGDPVVCREHDITWFSHNLLYFRKTSNELTTSDRLDQLEERVTALENPEPDTENTPKVGDKIKVTDADCMSGAYRNGDVLTISEVMDHGVFTKEHPIFLYQEEFELITEEQAEQAQKEAKFAGIGRKEGEFKVGDIAEVIHTPNASPVGTLVEITEIYVSYEEVKARGYSNNLEGIYEYLYNAVNLKLVSPVEHRFDK